MKRMRYVRLGSVLLLLFAFLLLAGCDKKDKTSGPAAAGTSEAAKQEISYNENILQEIRYRGYLVAGCKADTRQKRRLMYILLYHPARERRGHSEEKDSKRERPFNGSL